jgi:TRAP-type C4-dicarboxylate transport system substrate-binding protein
VLRLANANDQPYELEAFAREVRSVSNGRLRIEFVNNWRSSTRDAEPGILDDVRAGKVDLAWVGARAFRAAGVTAFDPLIAPFAVTDYEAERRVLTGPIGKRMLEGADGGGVRAIALLPGPLRLLAVDDAWSGAADLARKRINVSAGVGEATVRAFGAIPFVSGSDTRGDTFNATEDHLGSLLGNGYMRTMPHVAVEPLWPRPLVVIAGPQVWDELPAADRKALAEAGRRAVAPTLDDIRAVDKRAIPNLCEQGAQFFQADIADLRRAVAPVYAEIRRDAEDARNLSAIEQLRGPAPAKIVCKTPARKVAGGPPPGEYRWTVTLADARKVPGGATSGIEKEVPDDFRAVIERGHMVLYVSARGAPEEAGFEGTYSVYKDRIALNNGDITARWRVVNGDLVFSDVRGEGPADVVVFASHPWKRVRQPGRR